MHTEPYRWRIHSINCVVYMDNILPNLHVPCRLNPTLFSTTHRGTHGFFTDCVLLACSSFNNSAVLMGGFRTAL
jgi:hypothetical protein